MRPARPAQQPMGVAVKGSAAKRVAGGHHLRQRRSRAGPSSGCCVQHRGALRQRVPGRPVWRHCRPTSPTVQAPLARTVSPPRSDGIHGPRGGAVQRRQARSAANTAAPCPRPPTARLAPGMLRRRPRWVAVSTVDGVDPRRTKKKKKTKKKNVSSPQSSRAQQVGAEAGPEHMPYHFGAVVQFPIERAACESGVRRRRTNADQAIRFRARNPSTLGPGNEWARTYAPLGNPFWRCAACSLKRPPVW